MSEDMKHNVPTDEDIHPISQALFGWVEIKGIGKIIFWVLAAISVVLILLDFRIEHHPHFAIEGTKGFYGFVGFIAFTFVVLTGKPLGKLLRRDENYYGDADDDGEDR
ncbi:MAG: hypothetical protein V3V03_08825 [Hyphomonadaceae bacterium]